MYGILSRARLHISGAMLLVALASLGSGCAAHPSRGQSGSIEWEVLDLTIVGVGGYRFTVVLRNTGDIGVSFHAVKMDVPTAFSAQEQPFVHRAEPHSAITQNFNIALQSYGGRGTAPPYVQLQFRGVDDASKPIDVTFRVYRSSGRPV